jgi:hypothetical protein
VESLEAVIAIRSSRSYKKSQRYCLTVIGSRDSESRVEAGSNTSIVALRVVGGDKKGSHESEAVKHGRESHGS